MGVSLILWDSTQKISSYDTWFYSKVPVALSEAMFYSFSNKEARVAPTRSRKTLTQSDLRFQFQAFICLLSGSIWGLALVNAGSNNTSVKNAIIQQLELLQALRDNTQLPKIVLSCWVRQLFCFNESDGNIYCDIGRKQRHPLIQCAAEKNSRHLNS